LAVWLPTTKSQESTSFQCLILECNTALESSQGELQLWFRPCCDRTLHLGDMGVQSPRTPTGTISELQFVNPEKKSHLDATSVVSYRVYYKGEGGGFPQVRAMVSLMCSCCPWFVLAPRVLQLCTNHFMWVVCKTMWMSEACQLFLVPSRSSNTPLYPSKYCELGSGSKFQLLPHCRILGPSSGSIRNLGARHCVFRPRPWTRNITWLTLCFRSSFQGLPPDARPLTRSLR
jgi:hypothetical protein